MIKALFFDIDGTLISFKTHTVPESTVQAIRMAKERGVKVFISTGRPLPLICGLDAVLPYVDGYVTTNGAYNFVGDETVTCDTIAPEEVKRIIGYSMQFGVPCLVDGTKSIALLNENEQFDYIFRKLLRITTLEHPAPLEDVLAEGVLQLTPFFTQEQEDEAMALAKGCTIGRWHPEFVDITAGGIDKALGLQKMADYLGLKIEETMAFGDGGNDIPILVKAGIGVAMGNAGDEIKQKADYVTTHIDEDGIYNALRHFNVI